MNALAKIFGHLTLDQQPSRVALLGLMVIGMLPSAGQTIDRFTIFSFLDLFGLLWSLDFSFHR
jgi:hypothetical protein